MPVFPQSFRAYIGQAVRGQAGSATSERQLLPNPDQVPSSIKDAAFRLGVSHMTIRRCMRQLDCREWNEETWKAVSAEILAKKQWQELEAQLQKSGLQKDAARKRVQRYKRSGLTPDEARRLNASPESPKGTCTACEEEQVPGKLYRGKFYCDECYEEKTGISPTE